mgnify:CR=1 FL=1
MLPVIIDIERTSLAASFQNRRLFTRNNRTFGRWGGYFFGVIASKYPVATTSNTIASNSVILTHPLSGERSRHKSGDVPHLLYGTSRPKVKHIIEKPVWSTHSKQAFMILERPQFTTFSGFPSINDFTLSAVVCIMRSRASFVAHEICGVMMQFGAVRSGFSAAIGSVEATSTAA